MSRKKGSLGKIVLEFAVQPFPCIRIYTRIYSSIQFLHGFEKDSTLLQSEVTKSMNAMKITPKTMKSLPNSPFFSQGPWRIAIVVRNDGFATQMKNKPKPYNTNQKQPLDGTALKTGVSLPIHTATRAIPQGRGSPFQGATRCGENGVSASKTPIFLKYICIDLLPNRIHYATARIDFTTHLPQQHEPRRAQGIHRRDRARGTHHHSWTQAPSRLEPEPRRGAAGVGR